MGTADDRLVVIADSSPGPPEEPVLAELFALYDDAVGLATEAALLLDATHQPPNPNNPCVADATG